MNHTSQGAEALSEPTRRQSEGPRRWWAICDTCLITITVEAHPDRGRGPLPDIDSDGWAEGGLDFMDCPMCGGPLMHRWNSEYTTTWEDTDKQLQYKSQLLDQETNG